MTPKAPPGRMAPNWGGGPPSPLGEHEAYGTAGTVASPLLAGFALTTAVGIVRDPKSLGSPDVALVAFILATGLLLMALQATFYVRLYYWTRVDAEKWFDVPFPERFENSYRQMHVRDMVLWRRYRMVSHVAYNLGVISFLTGTVAALIPPDPVADLVKGRWLAAALAAVFLIGEVVWWTCGLYRRARPTQRPAVEAIAAPPPPAATALVTALAAALLVGGLGRWARNFYRCLMQQNIAPPQHVASTTDERSDDE